MKKDNIKSIVVLTAICLVTAAILGAVNHISAPIIERNAANAIKDSLGEVLEGAQDFESVPLDVAEGIPETVTGIYTGEGGAVVTVETTTTYSKNGPLSFTVGITADGKISGIKVTNYTETKDFKDYPQGFVGKNSEEAQKADTFSGVTISSTAFKRALDDAFTALKLVSGGPSKEEEALIKLFPEGAEPALVEKPEGAPETVSAVYKDSASGITAVLVETFSQYSSDTMVFAVGISTEGTVTGVEMINYAESKDFGDYPQSFIGLSGEDVKGADLYSGVTISSTAFRSAMSDAFEAVALMSGGPSKEEAALISVFPEGAAPEALELPAGAPETVKEMYKDSASGVVAVVLETYSMYSSDMMVFVVGISPEGAVTGIEIINYADSKSLGDYPESFVGKNESLEGVDILAGVTYSSTAFRNAVRDAFTAFKEVAQ